MTTVGDLLAHLDAWAPFSQAASWDPVGLQLGELAKTADVAAVCHEVNDAVVDAVLEGDVDILVTYHPLLFRPLATVTDGPGPAGWAYRLVSRGVSVIATHTNLDAAAGGTADALAHAIGLTDVRPFGNVDGPEQVKVVVYVPAEAVAAVRTAMAVAGAGTIGLYRACSFEAAGAGRFVADEGSNPTLGETGQDNRVDELRLEMTAPASSQGTVVDAARLTHPYEEPAIDVYRLTTSGPAIGRIGSMPAPMALEQLSDAVGEGLGHPPIRSSGDADTLVQSVAVVPGAGADFATAARAAGAEVLVTGDVRHHAAVAAARRGLAIIDATHEGTERPGMKALYRSVSTIVKTLDLTTIATNPWSQP